MIDINNLHLQYVTNQQGEQTAVILPIREFAESKQAKHLNFKPVGETNDY